ncbi:sodium-dependent bicarbonate transport family permease [uncultured Algimonas sp.]|uniref:sodium-dependent bicarbonate transport family permease n=1 Tax=uncultured Algimonas sp. TaxID=1547920 RepID=UPI0026174C26|nr:sodium-dependent bicarbonate transport family permease [uncultured Algimonas sp.]
MTALDTLLSPVVMFFALGLVAALLRSPMDVPQAFAKGLAVYLMMAIGLKGGVEMSKTAMDAQVFAVFGAGIGLSFGLPLIAYAALRLTSGLSKTDAAATAGHYGSISIVTFVAAIDALRIADIPSSGYLVAVAALMETPAIITALWLALRGSKKDAAEDAVRDRGELAREVLLNASIVVLIGALLIGLTAGEDGYERLAPFFTAPFQGILCLFMLDMGLNAGRGLRRGWRKLGVAPIAFGLYMPLIGASIGAGLAVLIGLPPGDMVLLMVLSASASYIAVPAAMRLALPESDPSVYLTLSLGVTFPFNIALGIPLYIGAATLLAGG